jgi:photosystem II stability/assembly factor-like uncharacterized protein
VEDSPTGERLRSVFVIDGSHAWAVGERATVLFWDGQRWTLQEVPSKLSDGPTLHSVFMVSPTDGWIAGDGVLLHWDGERWQGGGKHKHATGKHYRRLHSVHMVSPQNGWITGNFGTILHWDGHSWTSVENAAVAKQQRLRSVSFSSPSLGYCLDFTTGTIWRFHGGSWSESFVPSQHTAIMGR